MNYTALTITKGVRYSSNPLNEMLLTESPTTAVSGGMVFVYSIQNPLHRSIYTINLCNGWMNMMTNNHKERQIAIQGELIREYSLQLRQAEAKIMELNNTIKQLLNESQEAEEI